MKDDIEQKILENFDLDDISIAEVNILLNKLNQDALSDYSEKLSRFLEKNLKDNPDAFFAALVSLCCSLSSARFFGNKSSLIIMINEIYDEMQKQGVLSGNRNFN